jgi:hypothetical protein
MPKHRLLSIGYLNPKSLELLAQCVQEGALIVDIRTRAASQYRPDFSAKRLRERFGESYTRIKDLGNDNYNLPGAPIQIHNALAGIAQVLTLLEKHDLCFLCKCKQLAGCHTAIVIEEIQRLFPDLTILRLGEEAKV